jgi:hypothetical protein
MSRTSPTIIRRATTKPYILGIPTYPHLLPLLWCKELYPYVLSSCSIPHVWQISTVAEASPWSWVLDPGLAGETPAEAEHAILELASLLDAEVRVTEIILQALEARIVGLKVVRLRQLLLFGGWVPACAILSGVHSLCPPSLSVGRVPGVDGSAGPFLLTTRILSFIIIAWKPANIRGLSAGARAAVAPRGRRRARRLRGNSAAMGQVGETEGLPTRPQVSHPQERD